MIITGKLTGFDIRGSGMSAEIEAAPLSRMPLSVYSNEVIIRAGSSSFITGLMLGDYVIAAVRWQNPDGSYEAALPLVRHHLSDLL